jgi:CRP/FNR family transcriptional regulator
MMASQICADCSVRSRSLCGTLADSELVKLNRIGGRRKIARGEALIWAGDEAALCGNLLSGVLKMTASTADGREQTVGLLFPSDFVGRPFKGASHYTMTALTDAELCFFPKEPFAQLLEEHPDMERQLLERTFAALDEARDRMLMLARKSASEKIAGFLLDMASRARDACSAAVGGPITFDLPLTRGEMAELLGLTIETVSRQMTKLKAEGIIALPGLRTVTIRNRAVLQARAEGN